MTELSRVSMNFDRDIRRPCPRCEAEIFFSARWSRGPRLGRCSTCDRSYTLFGGQLGLPEQGRHLEQS